MEKLKAACKKSQCKECEQLLSPAEMRERGFIYRGMGRGYSGEMLR